MKILGLKGPWVPKDEFSFSSPPVSVGCRGVGSLLLVNPGGGWLGGAVGGSQPRLPLKPPVKSPQLCFSWVRTLQDKTQRGDETGGI